MGWNANVAFKESTIHGVGVFARERIAAGTKVWEVDASTRIESRETLPKLDARSLSYALTAGYLHKSSGRFIWYTDGMEYMNHGCGVNANVGLDYWPKLRNDHIIAFRDIAPGEELREDYGSCLAAGLAPGHWLRPLYLAHCPWHYDFLLGLSSAEQYYAETGESDGDCTNFRTVAINASIKMGFDRTARNPEARHAA